MLTVLLWLLPLSAAWAQPKAAAPELTWQAPRGCPTQAEVSAMLPRLEHAQAIAIAAVVERAGAGYRLRLRVRSERQSFERELNAGVCAVLAESTAFLVQLAATQLGAADAAASGGSTPAPAADALQLDTAGTEATKAPEPATEPEAHTPDSEPAYLSAGPPHVTRSDPRQLAADGGESAERPELHLRVGLGAAATDVGLSGLTAHVALDVTLALAEWSLGIRLGALLHPELRVAEAATVDFRTAAAQLLGCRLWAVGAAQIGPCITMSALRSVADTQGLTGSGDKVATWLTAGPALMLQLRLTRAVLAHAELGVWAALTPRPSFEVLETTLARAQTLAGYARLGVGYELW